MRTSIILLALLLFSCKNELNQEKLNIINGYWEIEKVVLADGFEKEYKWTTVVDYFNLEEMQGYRKKVQPLFDGTFDTSDDAQQFEIIKSGELFELRYKNELSEWTETLIGLDDTSLIIKNEEGVIYHYKRFKPLEFTNE